MKIYGTENTITLTEEIGKRLRGMRVRAELTQNELAQRAGVPKAVITRIENGLPIRMDSLFELMRALGCLGNLQVLLPEDEHTTTSHVSGNTLSEEMISPYPSATMRPERGFFTDRTVPTMSASTSEYSNERSVSSMVQFTSFRSLQ